MSVLIPKNAIILSDLEWQVARADMGDPQMGPGLYDPGGHRIGQLVVVIDQAAADQIKQALNEEFGIWDSKKLERVKPNGAGKAHRKQGR